MGYDAAILKAARHMIEAHGADAASRAQRRACAFRVTRDHGPAEISEAVVAAIVIIQDDMRRLVTPPQRSRIVDLRREQGGEARPLQDIPTRAGGAARLSM
jgi:hypothetical protein